MKSFLRFPAVLAVVAFLGSFACGQARSATLAVSYNVNQPIPDGTQLGLSDQRTISGVSGLIDSVTVSLVIAGGFNGDLYAQLTHSSGFAILLNRVGRTATNSSGYSDGGLNVVFDDDAATAGDVHVYRTTLFGNDTVPVVGSLSGTWKPDARAVDPGLVLNSSARTATLASFDLLNPNGDWTLLIADLDPGGQAIIQSWGLTLQLSVPEPQIGGLLAISMSMWCAFGRSRRLSVRPKGSGAQGSLPLLGSDRRDS